jgi:hypothetical protein
MTTARMNDDDVDDDDDECKTKAWAKTPTNLRAFRRFGQMLAVGFALSHIRTFALELFVSVGWADELTFVVRRAALPRARLTPPESAPCRSSTATMRTPCPGTHPSTGYARAFPFRAPLPRMRRRASFVPLGGPSRFERATRRVVARPRARAGETPTRRATRTTARTRATRSTPKSRVARGSRRGPHPPSNARKAFS